MSPEDYLHRLQRHDWNYEFSDDRRAYLDGLHERAFLAKARLAHDRDAKLWNQYAPEHLQIAQAE